MADWNGFKKNGTSYIPNDATARESITAINAKIPSNASSSNKLSTASDLTTGLNGKVDKVSGKGLSTNDYTTAEKTKLDGIESGAEVNVQADWSEADSTADDFIKNKPTLGTASAKNSTSVVTQSTDLVESGAVKDIVGWGNKNIGVWKNVALTGDATVGYKLNANGSSLIAPIKNNTNYTVSKKSTSYGNRFRIILFKNEPSNTYTFEALVIVNNNPSLTEYTFNSGVYNYVVFTYDSSAIITQDDAETMIEVGTTKTSYEPYHASADSKITDVVDVVEGVNLLKNTLDELKVLNTSGTWNDNVYTHNSVQYTVSTNEKGAVNAITANGTAGSSQSLFYLGRNFVTNENYKLSGISGGSADTYLINAYDGTTNIYLYDGEKILPSASYNYLVIAVKANKTVDSVKFYPMLRKVDITDDTYRPYNPDKLSALPNVIAPVENGDKASKAYAVGEHFIRDGAFCTVTSAISANENLVGSSKFTSGDVASAIFEKGTLSTSDDLDNITDTGIYFVADTPTNAPENMSYCTLLVHKAFNNTTVRQMLFRNNAIYCRRKGGNPISWSSWYKFEGTIVS